MTAKLGLKKYIGGGTQDTPEPTLKPKAKKKKAKVVSEPDPFPADLDSVVNSMLPTAYATKPTTQPEDEDEGLSDISLIETFYEMLADRNTIPGVGESRQIRDHRNHVDEIVGADGNPLFDYRFCSHAFPNRKERAVSKGFQPLWVKDRKPVPPGTPGAERVTVAGADLLVRRADLARDRRVAHDKEALARTRKTRETPLPEGVTVAEEKSQPVVVSSIGQGKAL